MPEYRMTNCRDARYQKYVIGEQIRLAGVNFWEAEKKAGDDILRSHPPGLAFQASGFRRFDSSRPLLPY